MLQCCNHQFLWGLHELLILSEDHIIMMTGQIYRKQRWLDNKFIIVQNSLELAIATSQILDTTVWYNMTVPEKTDLFWIWQSYAHVHQDVSVWGPTGTWVYKGWSYKAFDFLERWKGWSNPESSVLTMRYSSRSSKTSLRTQRNQWICAYYLVKVFLSFTGMSSSTLEGLKMSQARQWTISYTKDRYFEGCSLYLLCVCSCLWYHFSCWNQRPW